MPSRSIRFFLILVTLFAINSGCTRYERDTAYDYPNDVGTTQDHEKIKQTSFEIERVATSLGHPKDFHSFPVFVIGKDTPHAMGSAYCLSDAHGQGVYIGIRRRLLEETTAMNENGVGKSRLFLILLHEYGHCLFGRVHDPELLSLPNSFISLRTDASSTFVQTVMAMPASSMYPNAYITELSESLKKYYVGELFGLGRMKSLIDFEKLGDLQVMSTLPPAPVAPEPSPSPSPVPNP